MTRQDVLGLPVVVSVEQAARAWGISRSAAYAMIESGTCPFTVTPVGRRLRVLRRHLLDSLRIQDPGEASGREAS